MLVNNAVKAGVLLSLLGICAFGVYGAVQIEARYDPRWYLRPSSYQAQFLRALGRYFPDEGVDVQVYVGTSTTIFEGSVITVYTRFAILHGRFFIRSTGIGYRMVPRLRDLSKGAFHAT